jgi:hypothetical protein
VKKLKTATNIKKKKAALFIINKNKINFIENPNKGGIPAKESIVIKNNKLKGKITPNFFRSLKFLIYLISNVFNNIKNEKTKKT